MLHGIAAPFGKIAFLLALSFWFVLAGVPGFMTPTNANDEIDLGLIGRFLEIVSEEHNPLETRYKTKMDLVNQTITFHYEYDPDTDPSLQQIGTHLSDRLCRNPQVSALLLEGLVVRYVLEQTNGTYAIFEVDRKCAES